MQDNKWTIAELLARYDLEPDLRDVFVEGALDREILTRHLQASSTSHTFYEIDTVDVPMSVLANYGLTSGNKQRAIALSSELANTPATARVYCLVDRDLDHWFGDVKNSARLRWTSFCSIESHFLNAEIIRDIAITTGRAKIANFDDFIDSFLTVLRQLYSLRLADHELRLNLKWVANRKYLSTKNSTVSFDLKGYSQALLSANAALKKKVEFEETTFAWQRKLNCDIRLACRGHDYIDVLAWAISAFKGQREFCSAEAIERLFVLVARSVTSLASEVE